MTTKAFAYLIFREKFFLLFGLLWINEWFVNFFRIFQVLKTQTFFCGCYYNKVFEVFHIMANLSPPNSRGFRDGTMTKKIEESLN